MKDELRLRLKKLADLSCLLLCLPLYLSYRLFVTMADRDKCFSAMSQFLALFPGLFGAYLRKNFYRLTMTACARDCAIMFGTLFSHADTEIGSRVYIGANCNIGMSKIERFCTLGSGVYILSGSRQHGFADVERPIQDQPGVYQKITVGEDSWIGNGAIVMASVGKKCIVGAGSVVTRSVADYSIVAGNPARLINMRKESITA